MTAKYFVAILVGLAHAAHAGTISGTITLQTGGALPGAEVQLWVLGTKGYTEAQTVAANASGGYSFTTGAGNYLVAARGPSGSGANYGDRWYDVVAPSSNGYVAESADVIALASSSSTFANIDIALEILGGADGTIVIPGGAAAASMWVRMEDRGDSRIHHNDFSKALPAGLVSMRGLEPGSYAIIAYDPTGARDTLLVPGPFGITANTVGDLGTLTLANAPGDPYEGNNAPNCGAPTIDGTALHADPPQPWSSSGARIGPLAASDVDWYCFTAVDGDRLILTASTAFTFLGLPRSHPWTDPVMSFWRGARVTKLAQDDDGGGNLDAKIDTGPLTSGCHCVAVTTFGDANFTGAGQNSTGAYQLAVKMGNRPPVPSIKKGTTEVPAAPATFELDEGDTLALDLSYVDADHDTPGKLFSFVDASGTPVATATIALGATTGTVAWTAPADGATHSPYTLTLQANDAEFTLTKTVTLVVRAVNMVPQTPVPIMPTGGAVVASGAPLLTWSTSVDPDGDVPTYDVELYAGTTNGAPAQSIGLTATSWTPATIAENTRVSWRVRADDGHGGLSPWSPYATFLVDSANDPPGDPLLLKPAQDDVLAMRRPGLSVLGVEDPEGDAISYTFQISRDYIFTDLAWESPPIPADTVSSTTMVGTGVDLAWGSLYYARVKAVDVRGGASAWSAQHTFTLKANVPPGTTGLVGGCVATTYDVAPDSIAVTNVVDAEGEPVTFAFQLFDFDALPDANPIYQTTAPMTASATTTTIPLDLSMVPNGHYRDVVRAFDGTDYGEPVTCELTLAVPAVAGGCCSTDRRPTGPLVLGLGVLVALRRRRRHSQLPSSSG